MTLQVAYRYTKYAKIYHKPYKKFHLDTSKAFLDMKKRKDVIFNEEIVDVVSSRDMNEGFSLSKLTKALFKDVLNKNGRLNFYYTEPFKSMGNDHIDMRYDLGGLSARNVSNATRRDADIDLMFNCPTKHPASLSPKDHMDALLFMKDNLRPEWSLKETTRQGYKNLRNGDDFYSDLVYDNLNKYKIPFQTDKGPLDVTVPLIELVDMVQAVVVHPGHPLVSDLIKRRINNPITGEKLPIIIESEGIDDSAIIGLIPGHFSRDAKLASRHPEILHIKTGSPNQFMFKKLEFARKLGLFPNKLEIKHSKTLRSIIYPFVSCRMILTNGIKSFPVTREFNTNENCPVMMLPAILETIMTIQRRQTGLLILPSQTGVNITLEALNINRTIIYVPNIVNSEGNSVADFRRDLHVFKSSKSFDQLLSANKPNFHIHENSADQIRGMLLDVNEKNTVVFDDCHRYKHFINLNLLSYLLMSYKSHFKPYIYGSNISFQFDFNKLLNMKDFPRNEQQADEGTRLKSQKNLLAPWNVFVIRSIFDHTIKFEGALEEGNIAEMNRQFNKALKLIGYNYIDLLMAEILFNCEKTEDGLIWKLAKEKLFFKDLLGSCILSLAQMAKYFYPHLANFITKQLPCQKNKFSANIDIYRKIGNQEIQPNLQYKKLFDVESLHLGELMLDLNGLFKQIFAKRCPSNAETIHIAIHVNDNLRKFLFLGENWSLLKLVFNKYKKNWKIDIKLRLVSEYESLKMIIHESFEIHGDVRVHVAYSAKLTNSELFSATKNIKSESATNFSMSANKMIKHLTFNEILMHSERSLNGTGPLEQKLAAMIDKLEKTVEQL